MPRLALGKTPARRDPRDLKLTRYLTALPPIPKGKIGHADLMPDDGWGVLANDSYGDCVWAGAAHETILWLLEAGGSVRFSDANVLADYSAVTGFNPRDPNSDQGTDMRQALVYRRNTGVIDANGKRHKIGAFVRIDSIDELKRTIYLFGAAAVGVQFPNSAWDQFDSGQPWDVIADSPLDGGHYVPVIGYDSASDLFTCVTWGREQPIRPKFLARYMDEAYAVLSEERLRGGKSLEGFDLDQLKSDLAHVGDPVEAEPPEPPPAPQTDDADRKLWEAVNACGFIPHRHSAKDNVGAQKALNAWAVAKGL